MPTQIEQIKSLHSGTDRWHIQYPWFSIGQLIHTNNEKESSNFVAITQKTAIFFNDIQRLHYLLTEQPINKSGLLREYNIGTLTDAQKIPQQVQTKLAKRTSPEIHLEQEVIEEVSQVKLIPATENNMVVEVGKKYSKGNKNIKENNISIPKEKFVEPKKEIENEVPFKLNIAREDDLINEDFADTDSYANSALDIENALKSESRIKSMLDNQQSLPLIAFEPYHTIDYFASQGIKVDLHTDDRLGKQLKSFTSWLKVMKRLPIHEDGPIETDIKAVKFDHSLENNAVVTEAMVEVLIKQGKKEQAAEILHKLSLIHPEKNHYFAAQIEQLKN